MLAAGVDADRDREILGIHVATTGPAPAGCPPSATWSPPGRPATAGLNIGRVRGCGSTHHPRWIERQPSEAKDLARTCPESTIALMMGVAIAPLAVQNPERAVALSATVGPRYAARARGPKRREGSRRCAGGVVYHWSSLRRINWRPVVDRSVASPGCGRGSRRRGRSTRGAGRRSLGCAVHRGRAHTWTVEGAAAWTRWTTAISSPAAMTRTWTRCDPPDGVLERDRNGGGGQQGRGAGRDSHHRLDGPAVQARLGNEVGGLPRLHAFGHDGRDPSRVLVSGCCCIQVTAAARSASPHQPKSIAVPSLRPWPRSSKSSTP